MSDLGGSSDCLLCGPVRVVVRETESSCGRVIPRHGVVIRNAERDVMQFETVGVVFLDEPVLGEDCERRVWTDSSMRSPFLSLFSGVALSIFFYSAVDWVSVSVKQ